MRRRMTQRTPAISTLDEHLPTVVAWAARLCGPGLDPEDIAHDALITAMRRLPTLRDRERLEAWLFGITRRTVAGHRRSAWMRRWVGAPDMPPADTSALPFETLRSKRRAEHVQRLLEKLPAKQREVLVLICVEDHTSVEAAEILGVPEGTVRSRLRIGKARLRKLVSASRSIEHEGDRIFLAAALH